MWPRVAPRATSLLTGPYWLVRVGIAAVRANGYCPRPPLTSAMQELVPGQSGQDDRSASEEPTRSAAVMRVRGASVDSTSFVDVLDDRPAPQAAYAASPESGSRVSRQDTMKEQAMCAPCWEAFWG